MRATPRCAMARSMTMAAMLGLVARASAQSSVTVFDVVEIDGFRSRQYIADAKRADVRPAFHRDPVAFLGPDHFGPRPPARLGYLVGPLNVAASYMRTQFEPTRLSTVTPATFSSVSLGDVTTWSVGGSYDFGFVKPRAMVERDTFGPRSARGWLVGASVPAGPGEVRVAYSSSLLLSMCTDGTVIPSAPTTLLLASRTGAATDEMLASKNPSPST